MQVFIFSIYIIIFDLLPIFSQNVTDFITSPTPFHTLVRPAVYKSLQFVYYNPLCMSVLSLSMTQCKFNRLFISLQVSLCILMSV